LDKIAIIRKFLGAFCPRDGTSLAAATVAEIESNPDIILIQNPTFFDEGQQAILTILQILRLVFYENKGRQ
jgi:hypothetical protein